MTSAARGYRAEHLLAERAGVRVVIVRDRAGHTLVAKHALDDAAARRLRAEAELLASARGPGVIGLLGTTDDPPGLLLEYAADGSLAELLHGARALPPRDAVRVVCALAEVLEHVHACGIVHRDVKPSNVLFTAAGELRLADFGVAARIGSRGTLGGEWEELRVGTAPYAAPESPSTHPAADVFALGVVLYELLTGRLPWEPHAGETDAAFALRIRREAPVAPSARGVPLPRGLEALALQALSPRPDDRPASAAELGRAARRALRATVLRHAAAVVIVCAALALLLARIIALPA